MRFLGCTARAVKQRQFLPKCTKRVRRPLAPAHILRSGSPARRPVTAGLRAARLLGVSFVDANTGTAVGEGGTILWTTDGGANWMPRCSRTTKVLIGLRVSRRSRSRSPSSARSRFRTSSRSRHRRSSSSSFDEDAGGLAEGTSSCTRRCKSHHDRRRRSAALSRSSLQRRKKTGLQKQPSSNTTINLSNYMPLPTPIIWP